MIEQHTNTDDYLEDTTHEHIDYTRILTSTDKIVCSHKEKLIRRGHDRLYCFQFNLQYTTQTDSGPQKAFANLGGTVTLKDYNEHNKYYYIYTDCVNLNR